MSASFERRFGGLRRLYGPVRAQRIFDAHVAVIGIGGVGSWAAEAFARSGVGRITLIDMDHVGESNTNRQIHALSDTFGQSKVLAMADRIRQINPEARVEVIDDFVTPDNWPALLHGDTVEGADGADRPDGARELPDAVVDACDQMGAKEAVARWALQQRRLFVTVGAAGGKRHGEKVEVADLSQTTHDPLLAQLRYRLRKRGQAPREGRIGVPCVFSREAVAPPDAACVADGAGDGSLNCHGFGSSVAVTATFGLCAAGWVMDHLAAGKTFFKKK